MASILRTRSGFGASYLARTGQIDIFRIYIYHGGPPYMGYGYLPKGYPPEVHLHRSLFFLDKVLLFAALLHAYHFIF